MNSLIYLLQNDIRGILSVERTTTPFQTEIFSWKAVPGRKKRRSGTLKK
jgi:hypothetical protein